MSIRKIKEFGVGREKERKKNNMKGGKTAKLIRH
jgi:hypothetical protein